MSGRKYLKGAVSASVVGINSLNMEADQNVPIKGFEDMFPIAVPRRTFGQIPVCSDIWRLVPDEFIACNFIIQIPVLQGIRSEIDCPWVRKISSKPGSESHEKCHSN